MFTNWISKLCSHNIRFTEEIDQEIDTITEIAIDYAKNNRQDNNAVERFTVLNPYSQQPITFYFVVFPLTKTRNHISAGTINEGTLAIFNRDRNTLNIFPYNVDKKERTFARFKNLIQHEFTHILDPKMYMNRKETEPGSKEYYISPLEFDGYSKQITEDLRMRIQNNPFEKESIMNWLRTSTINPSLSRYEIIMEHWSNSDSENGTNFIPKLKTRIYNELFSQEM